MVVVVVGLFQRRVACGGRGLSLFMFWCFFFQVDDLKVKLAIQEIEFKQKNENADKLIYVVGVEIEKVSKEKVIVDEEEIKVEVINKVGSYAWFQESFVVGFF